MKAPQTPNHYFCCTCHVIFDEHCDECKPLCVPTTTQGEDELREHIVTDLLSRGWDEPIAQKWYDEVVVEAIQAELSTQREQARQEGRNEVLDALEKYAESSEMFGIRLDAVEGFIAAQRKEDKKGE